MTTAVEASPARSYWFAGAIFDNTKDQLPRFLNEGIWENGYHDKYLDLVRGIRPGDGIAIKSSFTRKRALPFDNRGHTISAMSIKAVGTVTENLGDGRRLRVNWRKVEPPREWYFFTYRNTINRVVPGDWMQDALIAFAFSDAPQDIAKFQNAPYWQERFGTSGLRDSRSPWTHFYEAMANALLPFQQNRGPLIQAILKIADRFGVADYLRDELPDGTQCPLQDICPFTALGLFTRRMKMTTRQSIAEAFASFLGVTEPAPSDFGGLPTLDPRMSVFFYRSNRRRSDDVDALWNVFAAGLALSEDASPDAQDRFASAFDNATTRLGVKWNLTFGLFWARPWSFPSLDDNSRQYIVEQLGLDIGHGSAKEMPTGDEYLQLRERLTTRFAENDCPVHSFPSLAYAAWEHSTPNASAAPPAADPPVPEAVPRRTTTSSPSTIRYTTDSILADGCFIGHDELQVMLHRLRVKKNLVLQGPPGTGKTWLAKRLAFALMGVKDEAKLRVLQFHPNMSYEDFVRGWRPDGDGRLALVDGPLMEVVAAAKEAPSEPHVVVIEEINRGNPAQIFGEALTLLEADKRTAAEAIELCHKRAQGERVFIPANVYVIGTMNIADRSLALVDFALRRRFAFVDLEPRLTPAWRNWMTQRCRVDGALVAQIEQRVTALNDAISADGSLGPQFRIGHSYVTLPEGATITDHRDWFAQVVQTEIGPLLAEYWFDASDKARDATRRLLEGL